MDRMAELDIDRAAVMEQWFERIAATYPRATATFLVRARDPFRNPVGGAVLRAIGPIYDQVGSAMDEGILNDALDEIIRIRSVQDFDASAAVEFVFWLKCVIRGAMGNPSPDPALLAEIDRRVDRVALMAFDCYTHCRERLHEIRANEIRARSVRLLERAGLSPVATGHEAADDVEEK